MSAVDYNVYVARAVLITYLLRRWVVLIVLCVSVNFLFFACSGDHRDLHRVDRRQRQMFIRDRRIDGDSENPMSFYK